MIIVNLKGAVMKKIKKKVKKLWKQLKLNVWNFVYTLVHRVDQFLIKLRDKF